MLRTLVRSIRGNRQQCQEITVNHAWLEGFLHEQPSILPLGFETRSDCRADARLLPGVVGNLSQAGPPSAVFDRLFSSFSGHAAHSWQAQRHETNHRLGI